jgi:hypothetical protein
MPDQEPLRSGSGGGGGGQIKRHTSGIYDLIDAIGLLGDAQALHPASSQVIQPALWSSSALGAKVLRAL